MQKIIIKIALCCAFSVTTIYAYNNSSVSNYKEINSNESSLINNDYDDNKLSIPNDSNTTIKTKDNYNNDNQKD